MHFEGHQIEDHYIKEHSLKIISLIDLIKSCQHNLDHLRETFSHSYSSGNGENSELLTQCTGCMCIEDL